MGCWAFGLLGRWAVGPLGRWAVGLLGDAVTSSPAAQRPSGPVLASLLLVLSLCCSNGDGLSTPPHSAGTTVDRPAVDQTYRPTGHMAAGDVAVHLFEWKWTDIAAECESVLGPAGFKAV